MIRQLRMPIPDMYSRDDDEGITRRYATMGFRVERLQAITEEEALADVGEVDPGHCCAIGAFEQWWDGSYGGTNMEWSANPWVWVMEFDTDQ